MIAIVACPIDYTAPGPLTSLADVTPRRLITLTSAEFGDMTIRDQRPAKFLAACMDDGASPQDFLNALNGRVFFWLALSRLTGLLNARLYRHSRHTVLHVDTASLLEEYSGRVQLALYNTGSIYVPNAPKRA